MPERGADPTDIEVEWQLDALDLRPVERWLAAFPRVVPDTVETTPVVVNVNARAVIRTVDLYLDTPDWRIGRSGYVLRVRHSDGVGEVTLKDTSPAVSGLRRRVEVTEPLPPGGLEALTGDGPVGHRLRALIGDAHLIHILEVRTRRHPYHLSTAQDYLGEIDLDDTIIVVGDDQYPVRMRRVEIEADAARVDFLRPLVEHLRQDCSLQPAILSKFEVGLLAAGLKVPTLPDLGPVAMGTDPSIGELATAVLRRHVGSMLAHEAGTRLGEDIEELHDMRVATRRLRAALALFADVLPAETDELRRELGWLAGELGAVRDLDVQIARLEGWRDELASVHGATLADLGRLLERERESAREGLLSSLDSSRYEHLVARFIALLTPGIGARSERAATASLVPATSVVPRLVSDRHRSVMTAAKRARRTGDPDDLHRLRIRSKRLRYALEFVSETYQGKTRPLIRQVVRLQDCLGVIQDAEVAADRLHALALRSDTGLSPATVFAMGGIAERYRRDADKAAAILPDHLRGLKGPHWHKLEKVMERRRKEGGGPVTDTSRAPASPSDPDVRSPVFTDPPNSWGRRTPTAPLGSSPRPLTDPEDDADWDDGYSPPLYSVPDAAPASGRSPGTDGDDRSPGSPPDDDGGVSRRRKEPVFLPAPAAPGRPGPARPAHSSETTDEAPNWTLHDRP